MALSVREALRKPPKSPPQLLAIPNREAVIAAFHRARTAEMTLLDIELETHQSIYDHNSGYKLVAFVREHRLNAQHIMPGEFPGERKLIGAAEILAQSLSIGIRRKEMENGRSGAPGGLQQRQRA